MTQQAPSQPLIPVRPWSLLWWFLLPAWALLWFVSNPPHTLDMALARPFFSGETWPWHASAWLETWLHLAPKLITIFFFVLICAAMVFVEGQRRRAKLRSDLFTVQLARERLLHLAGIAIGGLLCVVAIWWLKASTGVACPWNLTDFGGSQPYSPLHLPLEPRMGNCWPSGAAGSGFCLLPAYFMFRDEHPRFARFLLFVALCLGTLAGVGRMMSGAHFLSHVLTAFLVDWLISASVYVLLFGCRKRFGAIQVESTCTTSSTAQNLPFYVRLWHSVSRNERLKLALATSLWWAAFLDAPMMAQLLIREGTVSWATISLTVSSVAGFTLVGAALITVLALLPRKVFLPLFLILNIAGTGSFIAAYLYGVTLTPDMVRNFIETNPAEATGYLSIRSVFAFLMALFPGVIFTYAYATRTRSEGIPLALRDRLRAGLKTTLKGSSTALVLLLVGVLAIGLNFRGFSGAMRANKALRYQIAPVNVFWSTGVTLFHDQSADAPIVRHVVDPAPELVKHPTRATVLAVVVGETARAMNFALNGYNRDTTPELAKLPIINFPKVSACGTATAVSLPCMMSRIGRSDYNRERILSEEQLPRLLSRAGVNVLWIDNQAGCKGACEGVPTFQAEQMMNVKCPKGECTDDVLADAFEKVLNDPKLPTDRPTVVFLHMMGSHGPAYARRSIEARKAFTPECMDADLASCSKASVINAYDNSIRETDYVLARMIQNLQARSATMDAALLYLSDHGESLGESGLYLHGAPWWMAPAEQVQVPMIFWMNEGYEANMAIDRKVLEENTKREVSQEFLYSTVLGLVGVKSTTKRDAYDLGLSK